MKKNILYLILAALLLPLAVLNADGPDVYIRDIIDSPQRYYNLEVTLRGEVVNVQMPSGPDTRGFYVLMDNSDRTIRIVANTLPAPQSRQIVSGVVQLQPQNQEPYIREVNRMTAGSLPPASNALPQAGEYVPPKSSLELSPTIMALIGLIVIVIIALIVVIARKPKAAPSASGASPAATQPMRTKQVNYDEVNRSVGGIKTKQVPHVLAELVVSSGPLQGRSFPLKLETTIGRVNGDIALEDASVSGDHARISFDGKEYLLENRSQTNPVILNGERVAGSKALKVGDELIFGVIKVKFKLI